MPAADARQEGEFEMVRKRKGNITALVNIRADAGLVARVDALLPAITADAELVATIGRVTRSAVIRLALVRGVKSLERSTEAKGRPTASVALP